MYLLFDIGGTKMRMAKSVDGESFDEPKVVQTPKDYQEGLNIFEVYSRESFTKGVLKTAVGGIAGPLNKEKNHDGESP